MEKGGVVCDPRNLSEENKTSMQWLCKTIGKEHRTCTDVPAPDVMTNAKHMLWILDEYKQFMSKYPRCCRKTCWNGGSLVNEAQDMVLYLY